MPRNGSGQFLFVNKDPSSTSLSNNRVSPLPYSQINRHAQRSVKRSLSLRGKKGVPSATSRLVGWRNPSKHETPVRNTSAADEEGVVTIKREEELFFNL